MGLDAVVYKNLASVEDTSRGQVDLVDRRTGELEFTGAPIARTPPPDALIACSRRLGNASLVAWLAEEVRSRCDRCPLLLGAVLYSASHSGDVISVEQIDSLKKEVDQLFAVELSMPPDLETFLKSIYALVETARANRNPIVFV